jgi:hypothetical protein
MTLLQSSLSVLRSEPRLLFLPLSSTLLILVLVLFIVFPGKIAALAFNLSSVKVVENEISTGKVFAFLALAYFIIMFSNAGTVSCSATLLQKKKLKLTKNLGPALQHGGKLFRWALIAAIPLGIVLRYLGTKSKPVSQLLFPHGRGETWDLLTYFAVPAMIIEGQDIHHALHRSRELIRGKWKEAAPSPRFLATGSIALIALGVTILLYGLYVNSFAWKIGGLVYSTFSILFFSNLSMIARTALYLYACKGIVPAGFRREELEQAFKPLEPRRR